MRDSGTAILRRKKHRHYSAKATGWGYRIMRGRSAIILRTGPGIIVNLTNGKQFALSLNDPETPAALLSTLSAPAE